MYNLAAQVVHSTVAESYSYMHSLTHEEVYMN